MTDTTSTIHPTAQARRLHLAHLATTHRAPLVNRSTPRVTSRGRARATAFTPMEPAPSDAGLLRGPREA